MADPTRVITQWVSDNDALRGATVDLHIIEYSNIATPALATNRTLQVAGARAGEGPAHVAITLSTPLLRAQRYPRVSYNRHRCNYQWARRFSHDDHNYCNFPSDEFESQSKQIFDTSVGTENEGEQGWYTINCDRASLAYTASASDAGGTDKVLYATGSNTVDSALWDDTTRTGIFIYKHVTGDVDIDVSTKLHYINGGKNAICGIVIQPQDDLTSWIFWGVQHTGSDVTRHLCRETVAGVSTDATYTGTEAAYRIVRDGTDVTCYVRDESKTTRTIDTTAWTSKHTDTVSFGTGDLNVGLVFALDETGAAGTLTFAFDAFYTRYFAGGYTTCDGSEAQCTIRKNNVQFGGYKGLPDYVHL